MDRRKKLLIWISAGVALLIALILIFVFAILPLLRNNEEPFEITSVAIQLNGNTITSLEREITADDFTLTVLINDGADISGYTPPTITWSFIGESFDNTISGGIFTIGDTIGNVTVQVSVKSSNVVTAQLPVSIVLPSDLTLESIRMVTPPNDYRHIEGQPFNQDGLVVEAVFVGGLTVRLSDLEIYPSTPLTPLVSEVEVRFSHNSVTATPIILPVSVAARTLQRIEVTQMPNTVNFVEGQSFVYTGIQVMAIYEFVQRDITDTVQFQVAQTLTPSINYVTVSHEGMQTTIPITVAPRTLQGIKVDYSNARLEYTQGDLFDPTGIIVTAVFDFMELVVANFDWDLTGRLLSANESVRISFNERGITRYVDIDIVVHEPYTVIREVLFVGEDIVPRDASLAWVYRYMDEFEVDHINNTNYFERGLVFNAEEGEFEIPFGATVTLTAHNPAVIGFRINGQDFMLTHEIRTLDFVLLHSVDLEIEFIKIPGQHITIRFFGESTVIFNFTHVWNGELTAADLVRIAFMFDEENETFDNTFFLNDDTNELSFDDLSDIVFTDGDIVTVVRHIINPLVKAY